MGSSAGQIVSVAFGVLALILTTVCCAVPSWMTMSVSSQYTGTMQGQYGLWKSCAGISGNLVCIEYHSSSSDLQAIRAMTVISCLLTYLGFIILLIMRFGTNYTTFLQKEDNKPKTRLWVGVGLLLAGLLLIISVSWFPYMIKKEKEILLPREGSIETDRGAGIYVGYVAGALLLVSGGLVCLFHKRNYM